MLKYEYKEYENYIRNKYTTDQFIEMWNDAEFRYEVLKCVTGSSMDATDDPAIREKNEVE